MRPPTPPPPDPGTGLSKPLPRELGGPPPTLRPPTLRTFAYGVAVVVAVVVSLGGPGLAVASLFGVGLGFGVVYWVVAITAVVLVHGIGRIVDDELEYRARRRR